MGFGGVNAFALLSFEGTQNCDGPEAINGEPETPILVPFSGRTVETLRSSLQEIASLKNRSSIALLHCITAGQSIRGCPFRGYALIQANKWTLSVEENTNRPKSPVIFIFSGMCSKESGMLDTFQELAPFRDSIRRSENYLLAAGYDLRAAAAISNMRDMVSSTLEMTCFQIGMVDLLSSIRISPDMFLSLDSVGELLCAYVDGHFSHEEVIQLP